MRVIADCRMVGDFESSGRLRKPDQQYLVDLMCPKEQLYIRPQICLFSAEFPEIDLEQPDGVFGVRIKTATTTILHPAIGWSCIDL